MTSFAKRLVAMLRSRRRNASDEAHESQRTACINARKRLAVRQAIGEARLALTHNDTAAAQHAIARARGIDPANRQLPLLAAAAALREGRAYHALHLVESADPHHAPTRLMTNLVRLSAGQRHAAWLDLSGWAADHGCPAQARVMLAWLYCAEGRHDDARRALRQVDDTHEPIAKQLAMLLDLEDGAAPPRRDVAELLHRYGDDPTTEWFARSLGLGRRRSSDEVPLNMVEQLADELLAEPGVIPTLTAAQRRQCEPDRVALLRRALVRIVNELPEPIVALEALAELSRLAGDLDDAVRWVQRGLQVAPYSAKLALMLDQLDLDDSVDGLAANPRVALERVASLRPNWADVQHALAHRYHHDGLNTHAVEHLYRWLMREPGHPLATEALEELAA